MKVEFILFQPSSSRFLKNHEKIYKPDFVLQKEVPVIYLRRALLQNFS